MLSPRASACEDWQYLERIEKITVETGKREKCDNDRERTMNTKHYQECKLDTFTLYQSFCQLLDVLVFPLVLREFLQKALTDDHTHSFVCFLSSRVAASNYYS